MIDMVISEEIQIHLRQDIHAGIFCITVAKNQNGRINDQQADNHRNGVLMVAEEGKERHDAIAKCDALHNSPDTQMSETQEIALDGMIKPIDKQTDGEKQYRSFDDSAYHLGGGFEL